MTNMKMALTLILSATMSMACVSDGEDIVDEENLDTVEAALIAQDRGDVRVRWEDERRPCRDCRPDGSREFRGCVALRRAAHNRRVLRWLAEHDIRESECFDRGDDRDRLPYYRSR